MQPTSLLQQAVAGLLVLGQLGNAAPSSKCGGVKPVKRVSLGPRPFWLIDNMDDGELKNKLSSCSEMEMKPTAWSIGHRGGAPLQMPEETLQSMLAGTCIFSFLCFWTCPHAVVVTEMSGTMR
jgi:glycerophosphoryl diester phosphodiesterase